MSIHLDSSKRHDAVLLFDVTDGNPNGDPDSGNLPRVDPETMQGLVTDVAIKRKIRDYVDISRRGQDRYRIYVQDEGIALNDLHKEGYDASELKPTGTKQKRDEVRVVRSWMCDNFYDVRTFGAVMSTGVNAGQVRGPMQLTFSRSIDPIVPLDVSITRVAITDPEDAKVVVSETGRGEGGKNTEMGRKALIAYGLYRGNIFYSPQQANDTGFINDDLEIFWSALENMWDFDRSASRGLMACQGLVIFSHDNPLGNAPANKLLRRVRVFQRPEVVAPRSVDDYVITIDHDELPDGVSVTVLGM